MLALVLALGAPVAAARGAYDDAAFVDDLQDGLRAFYARDFAGAQEYFAAAVARVPENTFAIAFLDAAAAHRPGALAVLATDAADRAAAASASYTAQLQLGFADAFAAVDDPARAADAREAFAAAVALDASRAGAHDGLGVLRANERSTNRAKLEFQAALARDPSDVLAREYLGTLYQVDLKEPATALGYIIDVPNLVPAYADIDFHIASVLDDLHEPAAALAYATRGVELDVGRVGEAGQHGYTLLARLYLERKQIADAKRVLHASLAADPGADDAAALLERIDAGAYGQ